MYIYIYIYISSVYAMYSLLNVSEYDMRVAGAILLLFDSYDIETVSTI